MDRGSPLKSSVSETGLPLYMRETAPDPLQTEKLLYLVHRMRQMQENQSPPHSGDNLFHPSSGDSSLLFRSNFSSSTSSDQPLDFSAAKKIKREDVVGNCWSEPRSHHDGHTDSGVSDLSIPSLHSTHSTQHSPPLSIDSPREGVLMMANSASTFSLPRLSLSSPRSTPSPVDSKEGLLTMANTNVHPSNATNMFMAAATGQFHNPHDMPQNDMSGLLKLAGMASTMPSMQGGHPFPLPFMHKPVFPPPLSSSSPLPQGFGQQHNQESMSEMARIAATSNQKYAEFRDSMLKQMDGGGNFNTQLNTTSKSGGGLRTTPEPGSPAHASTPTTGGISSSDLESPGGSKLNKDEAYWERRRKNNEAAKRSRDARRLKETEIAMRAQFLEQENIQLKMELVQMKTQLGSIRDQMNRRQIAI